MKGFIFRLERLFHLRASMERQRAQELARAVRDEQEQREVLEAAAARLDRCGQQVADSSSTISTAGALRNLGITLSAAARQVEDAQGAHRAAVEGVENRREEFGEARKDRRIVERLRERRREAWVVEQGREEQKELDGLNSQRHGQKDSKP